MNKNKIVEYDLESFLIELKFFFKLYLESKLPKEHIKSFELAISELARKTFPSPRFRGKSHVAAITEILFQGEKTVEEITRIFLLGGGKGTRGSLSTVLSKTPCFVRSGCRLWHYLDAL